VLVRVGVTRVQYIGLLYIMVCTCFCLLCVSESVSSCVCVCVRVCVSLCVCLCVYHCVCPCVHQCVRACILTMDCDCITLLSDLNAFLTDPAWKEGYTRPLTAVIPCIRAKEKTRENAIS
jgi:hypothetical protein